MQLHKGNVSVSIRGKPFMTGLALGAVLMYIVVNYKFSQTITGPPTGLLKLEFSKDNNSSRHTHNILSSPSDSNSIREDVISAKDGGSRDNGLAASEKSPRILIWVMALSSKLYTKAIHVNRTWAKRADKVLYITGDKGNTDFPSVGLNIREGLRRLTEKAHHAFRYIYTNHFKDYDWFMKVDDDTYVIIENLKYFLADKNSSEAVFYGQNCHARVRKRSKVISEFASGGAGYLLSKEAVRRLATQGRDSTKCRQHGAREDVGMSNCLKNLGVRFGNTTDEKGRGTFFAVSPHAVLYTKPVWYLHMAGDSGIEAISKYPITFHRMEPEMIHLLDFFLYHAQTYGIQKV